VRYLAETKKCSERQACRLICLPRATARYVAKVCAGEAVLVERLKAIGIKHPRFGYRRAHALLARRSSSSEQKINHKRVHRLWKREGLSVRRGVKKKRAMDPNQERPVCVRALHPNHVWTVDFVQDQTRTGRRLRMLSVTDEFTRQSRAIEVGLSLTGQAVAHVLERLFSKHGAPAYLRCDNGPEFVALALRGFLHRSGVKTAYIKPGSPWQNGFAESFHSRFRDEFLNGEVFSSLSESQVRVETWRRWYNTERPHSGLGYQTPNEFAACYQAGNQKVAGTNSPVGT